MVLPNHVTRSYCNVFNAMGCEINANNCLVFSNPRHLGFSVIKIWYSPYAGQAVFVLFRSMYDVVIRRGAYKCYPIRVRVRGEVGANGTFFWSYFNYVRSFNVMNQIFLIRGVNA